ncbi:MAG TPA: MMPL family transporter [Pilimelia sp.]|nr:MMPL family transporter [Pilimelia sp.]
MVRWRWGVLAAAVALVVGGATWGAGVFGALTGSGFDDPSSESSRARERIEAQFGSPDVDVLVLYSSDTATVDDATFKARVTGVLGPLAARPEVASVTSVYDLPPGDPRAASLVARDRHATYAAIQLRAPDEDAKAEAYADLRPLLDAGGDVRTQAGGLVGFLQQTNEMTSGDIARAEAFAMPVLLLLLVFIFGGLVAAGMPLLIGILAILGAFVATRLLTMVTDVSVFAVNVITLLGLGMAIDYALFVVSRFREELAAGHAPPAAVARTMVTAGRTVMISGLTIALALASLLIFPQVFLRSMGLGGMAAVLVAMLASLTVLPALLAVLGHRVNALRVPLPWRRRDAAARDGGWARLARSVMRRPVLYAAGVAAVLLALATPALGMTWGGFDERVLPPGSEARVVSERIGADFAGGTVAPISVVVSGVTAERAGQFAQEIAALPGATGATVAGTRGDVARLAVSYGGEPTGDVARDLVGEIRALPGPAGAQVLVGGRTATDLDLLDSLGERLPWMATIMALATFILLFLAFGSVVLPLKAVLMNLVSIGASFGVVVWGFQEGHLAGLMNFTATGFIEPTNPILMLALLFGLATDYEVFLLSRVREEWDRTGDNTLAVARGLQHTGRIITAAALLLIIVVAGFATGGTMFIKMIGVGMIVAIVVDATLVRALLVPATMRLLGRWNWWAPGPLGGVYRRYGIRESDPAPAEPREPALTSA